MKKQISAMILVFACFLTMSGCTTANAVHKLEAAEEKMEVKLDAVEEQVEAKLDAAEERMEVKFEERAADIPVTEPASEPVTEPASVPGNETQPVVPPVTEGVQRISKEEAQQIALNYVGLSAAQVTRLRTEYEIDDRIPQYDVEFRQGNLEYEFEIHAENGRILSFDKDHD